MNKVFALWVFSLALLPLSASAVAVEAGYWLSITFNEDSEPIAGSGFTISESGQIAGVGVETDGTKITLSGTVSASGAFAIDQTAGGSTTRVAGVASSSTSFVGFFKNGDKFLAEFVTESLPKAGVYYKKKSGRVITVMIRADGKTYGVDAQDDSFSYFKGTTSGSVVKLSGKLRESGETIKVKVKGSISGSKLTLKITGDDFEDKIRLLKVY